MRATFSDCEKNPMIFGFNTDVKFDPETVPWFVTNGPPAYGLFTVTWNWILTVLPASNVPTECVTVSPPPAVGWMPGFTITPRLVLSCCAICGRLTILFTTGLVTVELAVVLRAVLFDAVTVLGLVIFA